MNVKKSFDKRIFFPIAHFLLSFVYEHFVLLFEDSKAVAFSVPINGTFSDTFEKWMCYGISKLMAFIIIFLLWGLLFSVIDKKTDRETTVVFSVVMALFWLLTIIQWPEVFTTGGDNYIPYSYAIRLVPEYWHSVYLSCMYTAALMVFPHNISISLLQCTSFIIAIAYLYQRINTSERLKNVKWVRFFLPLMLIFRDTANVSTNPERAEINVSFMLFFVSFILMDTIEKRQRTNKELILFSAFSAFFALYRSENIIIAVLGLLLLFCHRFGREIIKAVPYILVFGISFAIISLPSKVGEIKYYGKDYSIMNSFESLQNILNKSDSNLSYNGAEADLSAIEAIVPVEYIKAFGSDGYRRKNYMEGRHDFNQSCADIEDSNAYLAAYKRIIIHNPVTYAKTQINLLLRALGFKVKPYKEAYAGVEPAIPYRGEEIWNVGRDDMANVPGFYKMSHFGIRNKLTGYIATVRSFYIDRVTKYYLYTGFIVLEFLLSIYMVVESVIGLIRKKKVFVHVPGMALIMDMYFCALALVMPVAANMYFHAYIYGMYVVTILFFAIKITGRKDSL